MKIAIIFLAIAAIISIITLLYFKRVTAHGCRHRFFVHGFGKKWFTVTARGESRKYQWDPHQGTPYCPKCLTGAIIECVWCQRPIFARDPITLFPIIPGNIPEHAYVLHRHMVGCWRRTCPHRDNNPPEGLWLPQGGIEPFPLAADRPKSTVAAQAN